MDPLYDVAALIAEPGALEQKLARIVDALVPALACACAIDLVREDGLLDRVVAKHRDPGFGEVERRLKCLGPPNPNAPAGVQHILRSGKALLAPVIDAASLARAARDPEHLELLLSLDLRTGIFVPLRARGRPVGLMWLYGTAARAAYEPRDLALAERIGGLMALAIDAAFLARQAEDAVAVRDEFLSVASHELRTPLTSLSLQIEMLRRADGASPKMARLLERADQQVNRLTKLVHELLDAPQMQRPLELQRVRMDLAQAARDVLASIEEEARRASCALTLDAPAPVHGSWDLLRVEQVIANLVANALKYGRGAPVTVSVARQGDRAVLVVKDEGIGISPEEHAKIFERFERAPSTRAYGGLGLGLYIARQITTALGGSIGVESELGHGARFIVELPME